MTQSDFGIFSEAMGLLAANYPNAKPLTELQLQAYFAQLAGFEFAAVQSAFKAAPDAHPSFFPAAGELKQLVTGRAEDLANGAWTLLLEASLDSGYSSVRFFDPAQAGAMVAVFGSWLACCEALHDCSAEMQAHYAKQFRSNYVTLRRNPRQTELYHIGLTEADLRTNGKGWALRRPEFLGRVLLVGQQRIVSVEAPFETATGQLAASVRGLLLGNDAVAIRQFAEADAQRTQRAIAAALQPAPLQLAGGDEPTTAEGVRALIEQATRKHSLSPKPETLAQAA